MTMVGVRLKQWRLGSGARSIHSSIPEYIIAAPIQSPIGRLGGLVNNVEKREVPDKGGGGA